MASVEVTIGEPVITSRTPQEKGWLQGWYDEATEWVEDKTDDVLLAYSRTEFSDNADSVANTAQDQIERTKTAANNWLGYLNDPAKLDSTLKTVAVIVVVLGIVYVIATVAPIIRPLAAR